MSLSYVMSDYFVMDCS